MEYPKDLIDKFAAWGRKRWKGTTKAQRRAFAMKGVRARARKRNGGR